MRSYIGGARGSGSSGGGSSSKHIVLIIVGCLITVVLLVFICKKWLCDNETSSRTHNEDAADLETNYPNDPLSQIHPVATIAGTLRNQTSINITHNKYELNAHNETASQNVSSTPHPVALTPLPHRENDENPLFSYDNSPFRQTGLQDMAFQNVNSTLHSTLSSLPHQINDEKSTFLGNDSPSRQTNLKEIISQDVSSTSHPAALTPLPHRANEEKSSFSCDNTPLRQTSLQEPLPSKSKGKQTTTQTSTISDSHVPAERRPSL